MSRQSGFALLELVVGGALLLFAVQVSWWVVAVQARAASDVVEAGNALDTFRITRHILSSEILEAGAPGDFTVAGAEVHLRAFRGVALFCTGEGDTWHVNTTGTRALDLVKDSVLYFTPALGWRVTTVQRRAVVPSEECPRFADFHEERWTLDVPILSPVGARYFEPGAYRFSDESFRTRQRNGTWQPITETRLDADGSTLQGVGSAGVWATMVWAPRGAVPDTVSWVSWATW